MKTKHPLLFIRKSWWSFIKTRMFSRWLYFVINSSLLIYFVFLFSLSLSIYIYIYLYLLTSYLPAFMVTRKKKKNCQDLEITISRITAWGKMKKKILLGKEIKKKPTSSRQLKKIKRYAVRWSKEQKPTVKCCNATRVFYWSKHLWNFSFYMGQNYFLIHSFDNLYFIKTLKMNLQFRKQEKVAKSAALAHCCVLPNICLSQFSDRISWIYLFFSFLFW